MINELNFTELRILDVGVSQNKQTKKQNHLSKIPQNIWINKMTMINCKPLMVVPDQSISHRTVLDTYNQNDKPIGKNTNDLECHSSPEYYFTPKGKAYLSFF